jgi:hypothetical protein
MPECREDVLAQQVAVQVQGLRTQIRALPHPRGRVLPEWHVARIGIEPIPGQDLRFLADQPGLCITFADERPRSRPVSTIGSLVPDLPAARWQSADSAETTTVGHLCDPPPPATRPRDGLHYAFRHEFSERRFRDADMAAHMNEPDAAFRDETTGKSLLFAQQLGDLGHA